MAIHFHSFQDPVRSKLGRKEGKYGREDQKKPVKAEAVNRPRKAKFQADIAPAEDRTVRLLKAELQLTSNTDFFSDAIALFRWAVSERKLL